MLKSLGLHFSDWAPIFQMGLLFLEKEESRTPTSEIQVRTLEIISVDAFRSAL